MGYYNFSYVSVKCENATDEQIVRFMECMGFKKAENVYRGELEEILPSIKNVSRFYTKNLHFSFNEELSGEINSDVRERFGMFGSLMSELFGNTVIYY